MNQTAQRFDVTVVGVGAMGAAALYHLARRGYQVCGVERYSPGHELGSSHGDSRMIREAYHEHPDYVPLVRRAFAQWAALSHECGKPLLRRPGIVMVGPSSGSVLAGMRRSAGLHDIPLEELGSVDLQQRYPGLRAPPGMEAVLEPGGGYIHVEEAVRQMALMAQSRGALLWDQEEVLSWQALPHGMEVRTTRRVISTERLVVSAGPWTSRLMKDLALPLKLHKIMMLWFRPKTEAAASLPGFGFDLEDGFYYGLPQVSDRGVKVGRHVAADEIVSADSFDRSLTPRHLEPIRNFVARCLPCLSPEVSHSASCIYTMTPDEHFVVDVHPEDKRIAFASSCSGHGFKFAPVIGELLADLSTNGRSDLPASFLRRGTRF